MRSSFASACASPWRAGHFRIGFPSGYDSWLGAWRPTTRAERIRSVRSSDEPTHAGRLDRLELRSERLRASYRFTFAFHAREVRFERDAGEGFEPIFPEVFSFHSQRHDPAELLLQLEDLSTNPRLLSPQASRRDAEEVVSRLLAALPRYLERVLDRLEEDRDLEPAFFGRVCEDATLLIEIAERFLADRRVEEDPRLRQASYHLRKLMLRALLVVVDTRVRPEFLGAYLAGSAEAVAPERAAAEFGLFYALMSGNPDTIEPQVMAAAERAFYRWVEEVCLDESNLAFEAERSPFEDREHEVLRAVGAGERLRIARGRELTPFLRRLHNRDCLRLLKKLETWFLRQYDVHHAAVAIHHAANLSRGRDDADRVLSRHSSRNYAALILALVLPLVGAALFYPRAPRLFDVVMATQVMVVNALAFWFLIYRFCWKKDLTFFHASVPRIGAGIIVGYLPVFLIDEVWDLAGRPWFPLGVVVILLGFTTLLYLYVEVQRRLGDPREAFARARRIFLLCIIEAAGFGIIVTSLLGRFMVVRNWGDEADVPPELVPEGTLEMPLEVLRVHLNPFLGELPRVLGIDPFLIFPSAVLLMTFLAIFIGTFLQLLWEDLPITEPL